MIISWALWKRWNTGVFGNLERQCMVSELVTCIVDGFRHLFRVKASVGDGVGHHVGRE
jgi:hypothetical protein